MKKITYSKMGYMGRLGNMMFEIASLMGMAKRYNREWYIPHWPFQKYFVNQMPIGPRADFSTEINEPHYHHGWEYWDDRIMENSGDVVNIGGWLQSYRYWEGERENINRLFEFDSDFFHSVRAPYAEAFDNKEVIAISMRVGKDYKENGNYEILSSSYYVSALTEIFPSWRDYAIIIFCDDMEYAARTFVGENIYYAPNGAMEQLCLGTMCTHFILANSTFSWWMAYLGEKHNSIIIRPSKYFKGELKSTTTKDFWPEGWREWEYNKKLNFKDVTFTIPITIDSADRKQNLKMTIDYLRKHLDTHILVGEQGTKECEEGHYDYIRYPFSEFHRTKMLNEMANESATPIIVNQDADVITSVFQMQQAVDAIRKGKCDMVYPYDGRMARVPRIDWVPLFVQELDAAYLKYEFKGTRSFDPPSVGGVIFWNKESFVFGGMENERMVNYGPEDVERWDRFSKLGYKIHRVKGMVYHLDHWVGPNSGGQGNPHYGSNYQEMERIKAMNNEQLLNEIAKWPWVNQYMGAYYEEINEGSISSAEGIFKILGTLEGPVREGIKTILDVGCGVGSWKLGIDKAIGSNYKYYGIDLKVPKHRLQFPEENYREYDLNSDPIFFPFSTTFDMIICTEVAEHLKPESAEKLVELLCTYGQNVLFSAAIPHQGGNGHLNEQWQSYWANLFKKHGFDTELNLRHLIRKEKKIEPWYRQNIMLFIKQDRIVDTGKEYDYVLPEMYTNIIGSLTDWK